ncbi:MAG: cysteine desulfurase family protein [Candidatus Magasanikbacteria bacterium]|nr:cysteine desulfurase family protein [Candidatus Magasanikbacteria bacterium]
MIPKPNKIKEVYLDHAATTYTDKQVVDTMLPYFTEIYGNPSALYHKGIEANGALNEARRTASKLIGALPENIIFTAGGSESDNLAIYGIAQAHSDKGKHIITTAIEHHAVLHPIHDLEKQGYEVTYLKVNAEGFVNINDFKKALRPDTILVTIMYANNEVGTIEPISDIGREILKHRKDNNTSYPYFHTDACQAAEYLSLDVEKLHVDLMTINGSKIYGPKGIGMLYVRRGIRIKPQVLGGSQERKMRAGTENVPAIMGLAKALEIAQQHGQKENDRLIKLTNYFLKELEEKIPKIKLNGPPIGEGRLANNLNIAFDGIEGEALLLYLDEYGIMCSNGSACTSESVEPSHVLTEMGLDTKLAQSSVRFTLGRTTEKDDIDYVMKYLPDVVKELREINKINSK